MAELARKPRSRKYLISGAAGCGGFIALWVITKGLVMHGLAPENTFLDEILVGILAASLAFALETYHEARLRRVRQAAELMGQLNHYIRNSLQVILSCSTMHPGPASQEAVRSAVNRIQWVLDKIVGESELFSGTETYLSGKGRTELDMMKLLQMRPEEKPGTAISNAPPPGPASRSE